MWLAGADARVNARVEQCGRCLAWLAAPSWLLLAVAVVVLTTVAVVVRRHTLHCLSSQQPAVSEAHGMCGVWCVYVCHAGVCQ